MSGVMLVYSEAVDALPFATRAVFLLSLLDDLDYDQVGFRLGMNTDEVGRQLARALCEIDKALHGDEQ